MGLTYLRMYTLAYVAVCNYNDLPSPLPLHVATFTQRRTVVLVRKLTIPTLQNTRLLNLPPAHSTEPNITKHVRALLAWDVLAPLLSRGSRGSAPECRARWARTRYFTRN